MHSHSLRSFIRECIKAKTQLLISEGAMDDLVSFITPTIGPSGYPEPAIGQKVFDQAAKTAEKAYKTLAGSVEPIGNIGLFLIATGASLISTRAGRDEAAFESKVLGSRVSLEPGGDPNFTIVGENSYDGLLLLLEYSGSTANDSDYPNEIKELSSRDEVLEDFIDAQEGNPPSGFRWSFVKDLLDALPRSLELALGGDDLLRHPKTGKKFYIASYADVAIAPRLPGKSQAEFGQTGVFSTSGKKTQQEIEAAGLKKPTSLANAGVGTFECDMSPREAIDFMVDGFSDPKSGDFLLGVRCAYQYANSPSVGLLSAALGAIFGATRGGAPGAALGAAIAGLSSDLVLRFPVMWWAAANKKYDFAAANALLIAVQAASLGASKTVTGAPATRSAIVELAMQIFAGIVPDYILAADASNIRSETTRLAGNESAQSALLTRSEQDLLRELKSLYADI